MQHPLTRVLLPLCAAVSTLALDLRQASIVINPQAKPRERMTARLIAEEVEKRTHLRWPIVTARPASGPSISLTTRAMPPAEGFTVRAEGGGIAIEGNDERGTLFGAGWLLRQLNLDRLTATAPDGLAVTTAPRYRLRGHQIGYRPKVNSYDGWTPAQMEQYFRDLIVFGANAVELIPPRSDDDDDSPHFTLPKLDMMAEASRILDSYGVDVWIWYPAMDKDYSDPATVEFALREWETVYKRLPGSTPFSSRAATPATRSRAI